MDNEQQPSQSDEESTVGPSDKQKSEMPNSAESIQSPTPQSTVPKSPPTPIVSRSITRQTSEEPMDRRKFVQWLVIGWAAFAAIVAGYGTLILRFFFPNVLFEPKQSFTAGYPDDFTVGEVSEKFKNRYGVWIVRDSEKIFALSTTCTHLGCTPNWLPNENKYKCPCHGSGFYKTGINFEGPAPRPLERFKIGLSDDGEIVIDKTKKFQQEKGEWSDPESFIAT